MAGCLSVVRTMNKRPARPPGPAATGMSVGEVSETDESTWRLHLDQDLYGHLIDQSLWDAATKIDSVAR